MASLQTCVEARGQMPVSLSYKSKALVGVPDSCRRAVIETAPNTKPSFGNGMFEYLARNISATDPKLHKQLESKDEDRNTAIYSPNIIYAIEDDPSVSTEGCTM